ncbi:hypothetical protein PR002_g32814, partial [Phytophthora rubi]
MVVGPATCAAHGGTAVPPAVTAGGTTGAESVMLGGDGRENAGRCVVFVGFVVLDVVFFGVGRGPRQRGQGSLRGGDCRCGSRRRWRSGGRGAQRHSGRRGAQRHSGGTSGSGGGGFLVDDELPFLTACLREGFLRELALG